MNSNYSTINIAFQLSDPGSLLHLWRRLLALRKEMADLFVYGRFSLLEPLDEKLFMLEKTFGRDGLKAFVILNFSAEEVGWKGPRRRQGRADAITHERRW